MGFSSTDPEGSDNASQDDNMVDAEIKLWEKTDPALIVKHICSKFWMNLRW